MRLIDADVLREEVYSWGMNDYDPSEFIDGIDDALTVEAIPKDQYENRLKADVVAMLTELQLEIEEQKRDKLSYQQTWNHPLNVCISIIQQKINTLKGDEE